MTGAATAAMPVPQGLYKPASRAGGLVFTSGMTPRLNGQLQFFGPVRAAEPVEKWRAAVELAVTNALTAARARLEEGEDIAAIVSMSVFIAAEAGFTQHSVLADFASASLHEMLGDKGIGSRAAIGVATLPGNAPVEITLVAAVST